MAHVRHGGRGTGAAFDGTGPENPARAWGHDAAHAPAARLLLADELPRDERPRQADRVLLVGIVWDGETLLELTRIARGGHLKAGELAELPAGSLPAQFKLIGHQGGELVLSLPEGIDTQVYESPGKASTLGELAEAGLARRIEAPFQGHAYTLELGDRVVVQVAPRLSLIARYVRAARQGERRFAGALDLSFATALLVAGLALGFFFLALRITPRLETLFGDDLARNRDHLAQYAVQPEKKEAHFTALEKPQPLAASAKPEGPEGRVGKPDAKQAEAARSKPGAPKVDPNETRKVVSDQPLLKAIAQLQAMKQGAAGAVFGPGGLGKGINDALGGTQMKGPSGDANGTWGSSTRGTEQGGGGEKKEIGGLGIDGPPGSAAISLERSGPGKGGTEFIPGKTTVVGGLSRDEIERVVKRHYNEVKHCYEQGLIGDAGLYGKVELLLQINPEGLVLDSSIQQTTLGNQAVESCIAGHARRWVFPPAKGGGSTQVTYPYVFKATGE